jgi:hypothetical protein
MHRRIIYTALAWAPMVAVVTAGDANLAFATTTTQVVNKTIVYEDRTTYSETPFVPETVTVDKYYTQLDIPVRRRVLTDPQEYAQAPHTPFALAWARALDTPVRRRFTVAEEGSIFGAPPKPEANDAIGWHRELDTPVRRKFTWYGEYGYGNFLPHTNDTRWYSPLSTPTRLKQVLQTEGATSYYPVAEVAAEFYAPSTISGQIFRQTVLADDVAYSPYTPVEAELVTVDKFWRQLDVPVRRKTVTAEEGSFFPPGGKPEANDTIGWHRPLDAPHRVKRLLPPNQASLTFVAAAPGNGNAYNWFLPLEIPTRARKLNEFPSTAIPVYFTPATPGAGFEYNWWSQLDEPVRPRPSIKTSQQQSLTVPPRLLTVTLEYAWHQPLTTPTRLAWLNRSDEAQGNVNPIVPYAWQQLDTPTRRLRSVYTAPSEAAYQVENVTIEKWWRELHRPIYTKRIDSSAFARGNINPVVPLAWQQLHTQHRLKGRIDYPALTKADYPFAFPGNGNGTTQPWPALSEPVRLKSYYHQPNAGLVWSTSFVLPAFDPDRLVFVRFEQRTISVCEDREADTSESPRIVYAID